MKKTAILSVLTALSLAVLAGCGVNNWDGAEKAIDNSIKAGDYDRAVRIGQDYIKKDPSCTDAYKKLIEIYRDNLNDPETAREMMITAIQATEDGNLLQEYLENDEDMQQKLMSFAEGFPTNEELLLEDKPFSQWTYEELEAWLPVTKDSYEDISGADDYYRSERFKNLEITINCYDIENPPAYLRVQFGNLGNYNNRYELEGPEPTMPRQIEAGDSRDTVLQKLGMDQELRDLFAPYRSIYLTLNSNDVRVWVYGKKDGYTYEYVDVSCNTRNCYGGLNFQFDDKSHLEEYSLKNMP